jgi:hypothetical protein
VKIRQFGLEKLLKKTRHIRELHNAMTNFGTSIEIVRQFEAAYSNIWKIMKHHQFQEPGPAFAQYIKQLEVCASIMKRDIEKVNVGNLEILLNKKKWVNECIVEEYNQSNEDRMMNSYDEDLEIVDPSHADDMVDGV